MSDWIWPHWLERQLDPASPDYLPQPLDPGATARLPDGLAAPPANRTNRTWTLVGNVGSSARATVDPRGLVSVGGPGSGGGPRFSLDWWIGAEDRWHLPSREAAVRQHLVDDAPVVETAMRVPGGDAVHRSYAVRDGERELVVVEIENTTPIPFAVALAVRPYDASGLRAVHEITLDGATVVVDGMAAVELAKAPSHAAASTLAGGDSARTVLDGRATERDLGAGVRCTDGMAQAAFLFPLAHTAVLRVAVVLTPGPGGEVGDLPDATRVAAGWRAQSERGAWLELPEDSLARAVAVARRQLLLAFGADDLAPAVAPGDRRDAVAILDAAGALGWHDEVARAVTAWWDEPGDDRGAVLVALGHHWRRTGDLDLLESPDALAFEVARSAKAVGRGPAPTGRWSRRAAKVAATEPDGRDAEWSRAALAEAGLLLRALGQPDAAAELEAAPAPVHPDDPIDPGPEVVLALDTPVGPTPGGRIAHAVREQFVYDGGVHLALGPAGLSPRHTALLGAAEAAAHDPRAVDRLDWLLAHAGPTGTWPATLHPQRDGGTSGPGHDVGATAAFLLLVRALLVTEVDGGLELCPVWPARWLGQGLEVHDLPTRHGPCSFAIRWHGERPALLWEVEAPADRPDTPALLLTAPGLDPSWSSGERRGEALLAPPTVAETTEQGDVTDATGFGFGPAVAPGETFA